MEILSADSAEAVATWKFLQRIPLNLFAHENSFSGFRWSCRRTEILSAETKQPADALKKATPF